MNTEPTSTRTFLPDSHAATPGGSRFDLQRAALDQLMGLASECSRNYHQLELTHSEALAAAEAEFGRAKSGLRAQLDVRRAAIEEESQEAVGRHEQTFEEARTRIAGQMTGQRSELDQRQRRTDKQLGKEHSDGLWLVDTMLEGESARIEEANASMRKALAEDARQLDDLRAAADALAEKYGQTLPPAGASEEQEVSAAVDEPADLERVLESRRAGVEAELARMRRLLLPKVALGRMPWILASPLLLGAAVVGHALSVDRPRTAATLASTPPDWRGIGLAVAVAVVLLGTGFWFIRGLAIRQLRERGRRFGEVLAQARALARADRRGLGQRSDEQLIAAKMKHEADSRAANARNERHIRTARARYEALLAQIESDAHNAEQGAARERDSAVVRITSKRDRELAELKAWHDAHLAMAQGARDDAVARADRAYGHGQAELVQRWERALRITRDLSDESDRPEFAAIGDWRAWRPPQEFAPTVRFGELAVDMRRFTGEARDTGEGTAVLSGSNGDGLRLPVPEPYNVPALLAFPDHANLLIKHEPDGRDAAVATLRLTMLRLLTSLPPGRVHFTLIDPVGLGRSFAGFMHLADFDDALVGGRVWTDADQIEQRLTDLTEHMETVIQKYLRNEFETIDAYNAQAGELAEPYRFVVVADLPIAFTERSLARLASIAASGARCGVHVLAALDVRQTARGSETLLEDLDRHSNVLLYETAGDGQKHFRWQDPTFGRLPLTLDSPPDESALTDVLRVLGQAARDAKRVEVPFHTITPRQDEMWSLDSAIDLHVPVGRTGATRLQTFSLGRGVAQHALVAGKTGSGKSTLLNVLVTNLSLWYAPDQLELYLVDFKRGVEFKAYAAGGLPHARAVAIESDREFGLSVLQRLDEELGRRGDLFRNAGVQDLAAFRRARRGDPMPRVLLIVDEFQEMFSDDDKLAQDAALLIDRLVRQGRAFGIHVILGSQTLGGQNGLARPTLGQMAVRVALQCTEADSQLILGDDNAAARLLNRPGEAIYNDAGGAVEANSPFQVAWLDDELRDDLARSARDRAQRDGVRTPPMIVFEGNAPADLRTNDELRQALAGAPVRRNAIYLGDPVAIKEPTHVLLRRQAGSNLLVVGQQEETVLAVAASAMISLVATAAAGEDRRLWPRFLVLDGTPGDSQRATYLASVARRLPAETDVVDYRAIPDALADLAAELNRRLDSGAAGQGPIILLVNGLQRYRNLTRNDDYGFVPTPAMGSSLADILKDDEGSGRPTARPGAPPVQPGQVLLELLRNGPAVGMHVLLIVDTLAGLERRLGREALREFDARVLFQMSGNDSSVFIDSLAASRLGFYRGLVASEELGTLEKFRPYSPPGDSFINEVGHALAYPDTSP